ncbi:hypothetical protein ABH926_006239 [Catenulispora sp. GP43]|uniref:hypothetical protein n=1 Tax=Catenulispora sp. GP43 TaxID=3156263 RepID=UPI0035180F04
MLLILGLIILIGAGVVGAVAVLDNRGASHQLPGGFHAFGHDFHGSSGQLFFWGAVVGAVAMFGLFLLLAGLRHELRFRAQARRDGVRNVRRTRRVRGGGDPSPLAEDDRDRERDEDLPSTTDTTDTTRDRESEPVRGESEDGADHDGTVKA